MPSVSAMTPDASKPSGRPYTARERSPIMRPRISVGVLPRSRIDIVTMVNDCTRPANASTPSDTLNSVEAASTAIAACHATDPRDINLPALSILPMPAMTTEPTNAPAE